VIAQSHPGSPSPGNAADAAAFLTLVSLSPYTLRAMGNRADLIPAVGGTIPSFERTTGFANWNRYAAVNDEFIGIHMDDEEARAIGQPGAFGMGNLRLSYLHAMLDDWLGDAGTIVDVDISFRGMNRKGDVLNVHGTVTGTSELDGDTFVDLAVGVTNQDGVDTTPGTATVLVWGDGGPSLPVVPGSPTFSGTAAPGVHLTEAEIARVGDQTDPITSPPVDANDIRRWAIATHWPERPPAAYLDEDVAAAGPWGGMVAPRDLDPFAWRPVRPWAGTWLRSMSAEPGHRVLNGGQHNAYGAPIRRGDRITAVCTLVDVFEKDMKLGPTTLFTTEQRWTNQDGELVRLGWMTSLYY
jgi:acyl dehydratase